MSFRPVLNSSIHIGRRKYSFMEHPSVPGMPYGQIGRRATVYQVRDAGSDLHALKIFTRAFRTKQLEISNDALSRLSHLPGLRVCKRSVITSTKFKTLVGNHPDLQYSILMPWVRGQTWQEILLSKQTLTAHQGKNLALQFANILAGMEDKGLAHCDLSGPNVLVVETPDDLDAKLQLVDVEEMFGPNLEPPEQLPAGSAGYAHKTSKRGLWGKHADRFAGAILLAEMLCWFDSRIRNHAYGEQFFAPEDMQKPTDRYLLLRRTLATFENRNLTKLLEEVWQSSKLSDCPSFAEWSAQISKTTILVNPRARGLSTFKPSYTPLKLSNKTAAKSTLDKTSKKVNSKKRRNSKIVQPKSLPNSASSIIKRDTHGSGDIRAGVGAMVVSLFILSLFTANGEFIFVSIILLLLWLFWLLITNSWT